jgi:hypothetical protein
MGAALMVVLVAAGVLAAIGVFRAMAAAPTRSDSDFTDSNANFGNSLMDDNDNFGKGL